MAHSLTPLELKLIYEYDLVEIEPLCSLDKLDLMYGITPSCTPLSIVNIPFYVALPLKESNLVQIRLPSFLLPENIISKIEEETSNQSEYCCLPDSIFVIGKEIVKNSYNADQSSVNLLDQLKEIRFKKTLIGLENLDGSTLNLNNLTIFEFNEVKSLITKSMDLIKSI